MIVFLLQLQEQHLQHDWYTVSSPTVFCLPLCSYLSTMNKPSRGKTHALARTSEWAVSAVESLSSTQTKKKRENLCASQVQLVFRCFTFEILLLEVGPLEGALSSFVHHGLVIVPLWDKAMSHCGQLHISRVPSVCEMNNTAYICPLSSHCPPHSVPCRRSWSEAEFLRLIHAQLVRLEPGRHLHQRPAAELSRTLHCGCHSDYASVWRRHRKWLG